MHLTENGRRVLTALQCGIEPVEQPFRGMALPEDAVVALLRRARDEGLVRRFGGVFDARRLGYQSVLCALDVDERRMQEMASIIVRHPGVTHCYARCPLHSARNYPTLWFTLAMMGETFDAGLDALRAQLEDGGKLLLLPALRRFKIDVVFDLRTRERDEQFPGNAVLPLEPSPPPVSKLRNEERKLVRLLDQQLPLSARPFDAIARQLAMPLEDVLQTLQGWKAQGVLRRIAAILHHRQAGYRVNGMCVWPVDGDVVAAGRRVAVWPEVTHCYQRPRLDALPFDLYAMIHSTNRQDILKRFESLTADCALQTGMIFVSCHEFKKTSMKYFADA